ncbi:MAG: hypothetical protein WBC44_03945 [Planctomycetaceae bacterium]
MLRLLRYLWAFFPGTMIGLLCVPLAVAGGGRCRVIRGCVEASGGPVTWFLRNGLPWIGMWGGAAVTLGHVILGQNERCLDRSRDHEHVHVRQYERWGPLFLPAYFGASAWLWCRGRQAYLDNPFEREAFDSVGGPSCEAPPASDREIRTPHG